ncbi:MAG: hypothetical protein KatS3mg113_0573 [Planctomycetaceae bacterium]|nr:MAG: hypothetical protein KatS3mg113_0573 [Planctomycetaceae bacterium]
MTLTAMAEKTLHRQYGIPEAINVGDHLIGLGYRLISMNARDLDPGTVSDILDRLAQAHQKLCEGQGAELRWQSTRQPCSPLDAMKIYALKTAPAFEAALYAGIRLAGPAEAYDQALSQFCRHVGVGFQILNDLKDWHEHDGNKCVSGRDAEMAKPTLLLALAFEAASAEQRSQLMQWLSPDLPADHRTWQLRQLYQALGVFRQAELLVEKCKARAEAIADEIQPDPLRQLFYYLVDTILTPEHQAEPPPAVISLTLPAGVS